MPPLLFLDVDGVLHPTSCLTKETWFRQSCMAELHRVCSRTGCRIILSSTWRLSIDQVAILNEQLEAYGIRRLCYNDCTKEIRAIQPETITRAQEIAQWCMSNGVVESHDWAVLDDLRMEPTWGFNHSNGTPSHWCSFLEHHFVRTSSDYGLTRADADRVISLLIKEPQAGSTGCAVSSVFSDRTEGDSKSLYCAHWVASLRVTATSASAVRATCEVAPRY